MTKQHKLFAYILFATLIFGFVNVQVVKAVTFDDIEKQIVVIAQEIKKLQIVIIQEKIKALQIQLEELIKNNSTTPSVSVEKSVQLLSPNGGEKFTINQNYEVKWGSSGFSSDAIVEIKLLDARYNENHFSYSTLLAKTKNIGSYNWSIPEIMNFQQAYGGLYKIAVFVKENDNQQSDLSDNYFSIYNPLITTRINIITPDGGEVFQHNNYHTIKWDSSGPENYKVSIFLKKDNIVRMVIAENIADKNYYNWAVPTTFNGSDFRISINMYNQYGALVATDTSNYNFYIIQ